MDTPKHDAAAEASVAGAAILDPASIDETAEVCGPEMFGDSRLATVYRACIAIHRRGDPLDLVTLRNELGERIEAVGGMDTLMALTDAVPAVANAGHYARLVREKWQLRRIAALGELLKAEAGGAKPDALLDRAHVALAEIAGARADSDCWTIEDAFRDALEEADMLRREGKPASLSTGVARLDAVSGGMSPGRLTILAARPHVGKSALSQNIAAHVASIGGAVALFTCELSAQEVSVNINTMIGGPSGWRIRGGRLEQREYDAMLASTTAFRGMGLKIIDAARLSFHDVTARARALNRKAPLALVVVDYLQLLRMDSAKGKTREREVAEASMEMKSLARELKTHVLLLSQLSRPQDKSKANAMPRMDSLRDSGAIEQDADNVWMLCRPMLGASKSEIDRADSSGWCATDSYARLAVAKNRQTGVSEEVLLGWERSRIRFTDHPPPSAVRQWEKGRSNP